MLHKYTNLPTDLYQEVALPEEQRWQDVHEGAQSLVCKYLHWWHSLDVFCFVQQRTKAKKITRQAFI